MIESLKYSVTFPTNGLSLSGDLSFAPGITAVTGRNGSGKTFAASEMVRYLIYGKQALRQNASDYKTLVASGRLALGGAVFDVFRGKKETVTDESGAVVAVGAEAVNQFLRSRIGFDLDVFDVVCAAQQKDSERLTKLRPAARKQMIDDIVGLSQNEAVEGLCRKEASRLRRDASTLREAIVVAVEPARPDGYEEASSLADQLKSARETEAERSRLEKLVLSAGVEPRAPLCPEPSEAEIAALEQHEKTRVINEARAEQLSSRIAGIREATYTLEQLDRAEAWENYADEVDRRGAKPTMLRSVVEDMLSQWQSYKALSAQDRHKTVCPECAHEFMTGVPVPEIPDVLEKTLVDEHKALQRWETPLAPPEGEPLYLDRQIIAEGRRALEDQATKQSLVQELEALYFLEDLSERLSKMRRTAAEWSSYRSAITEWKLASEEAEAAAAELAKLPVPVDIAALNERYTQARVYEAQYENFLSAKSKEDELTTKVTEHTAKAEAYKAGAEALQRARAQFKAFLAPSLGRVASSLLSQMTNGKFNSVVVDEEMSISINGQDVGSMSGAEATLANVALRLALGQVLTAKVFPVFIGDEIDADADEEWAPAVAEALSRLRTHLKQIILISHKSVDWADNHIHITRSSELS